MNTTLGQLLTDVIVRQLGNRNVELVANISPKCTKHFIVELAWLIIHHEFRSLFESLGGYLVGLLATHLGNIGVIDGTLAEDYKQRDEHQYKCGNAYHVGR